MVRKQQNNYKTMSRHPNRYRMYLDCCGIPYQSEQQLFKFSKALSKKIKMTVKKIVPYDFGESYTYVIVWAESHMVIHTWPEYDFMSMDLHSCKEFSGQDVIEFVKRWYNPTLLKQRQFSSLEIDKESWDD